MGVLPGEEHNNYLQRHQKTFPAAMSQEKEIKVEAKETKPQN